MNSLGFIPFYKAESQFIPTIRKRFLKPRCTGIYNAACIVIIPFL